MKKNGYFPAKGEEAIPWGILLVDTIDQNKFRIEVQHDPIILKYLTMIDPTTGWFEIAQYNYKQAVTIDNLVGKSCICRCPRPTIIMYNRRN